MNPGLKYALARMGIFAACAVPAMLLLPAGMSSLLKIMIALVVSAGLSFVLLKRLRDEVAQRMSANARNRVEQKQRLRAALAGEDEAATRRAEGGDRAAG